MEDHTPHDNHRGHAPVSEAAHGQAMPAGPAHPALDDDQAVHQHDKHAGHSVEMFRGEFWLSPAARGPGRLFSAMFADLLGYRCRSRERRWISPVLGTVVFFYGGWPFLKGGWPSCAAGSRG